MEVGGGGITKECGHLYSMKKSLVRDESWQLENLVKDKKKQFSMTKK